MRMDILKFEAQRMLTCIVILLILTGFASSHTVITYPGWRENVLKSSGTVEDTNGLGVGLSEKSNGTKELLYPYGQEWIYPCGGAPTSTNRTKWPIKGGAFAFQPGWFPGHKTAFIYVNIGLGTQPPNISQVLVPPFQLVGPTADPYPGTFCLMHVEVPETLGVKKGDNATLQLIETAGHGAALYNCVDITFSDPDEVEEVTEDNCFNSSTLSSKLIYEMSVGSSGAEAGRPQPAFLFVSFLTLLWALLYDDLP